MAVTRENLHDAEQDMDLSTRGPRGVRRSEGMATTTTAGRDLEGLAEELLTLKGRIAALKATPPTDPESHCRDCFLRGVRAAVGAIEGPRG